jgi:regulatory protein
MGKITKIEEQKKKKNRVNIYIDGEFSSGLYKDTILKYHLYEGKEITKSELSEIQQFEILQDAKEKALNYLSYRTRSKKEIKNYLYKKNFEEEIIYNIINDFENSGLIDDKTFAEMWVKDRSKRNPKGNLILRKELIEKGISEEIINSVLKNINEKENAKRAASKALKKYINKNNFKEKILSYLSRRGFPYYLSKEITREIMEESK